MVKILNQEEISKLNDSLADKRTKEYKSNKHYIDILNKAKEDCKLFNGFESNFILIEGCAISQAFLNREWYKVEVSSIKHEEYLANNPFVMDGHLDEVGFIDGIIGKCYYTEVRGDELFIIAAIFDNKAAGRLSIFPYIHFSIGFTGDLVLENEEYIVKNAAISEISVVVKPGNAGAIGEVIEVKEEEEQQTIEDEIEHKIEDTLEDKTNTDEVLQNILKGLKNG